MVDSKWLNPNSFVTPSESSGELLVLNDGDHRGLAFFGPLYEFDACYLEQERRYRLTTPELKAQGLRVSKRVVSMVYDVDTKTTHVFEQSGLFFRDVSLVFQKIAKLHPTC